MTAALNIKKLTKSYGGSSLALRGIDLQVQKGDFFALLGPNGAGKSTAIGIVCSLVRKTSGQVEIFGFDIDRSFSQAKQHIGVVPQEFNFNVFEKVQNILETQAGYFGIDHHTAKKRAEKYLSVLELWDKRNEVARELSGGMKRRLMIARALVHEPELLILDEPTAGVDIEIRRSMWDFLQGINDSGRTIILTTHYLEEAEQLCKNIAIIDQGQIVENTSVKELVATLNSECFILDVDNPLKETILVDGYSITSIDEHTIEVEISKGQTLNQLFSALSALSVKVHSMRNKSNRLEELFMSRVGKKNPPLDEIV